MKKIVYSFLALLLLAGVAYSASIPEVVNPKAGPEVWLTTVFNNSGGTMDVGDVAVWQIGSSTGTNDNYVTTTTTAATHLVAGVVYGNDIADQDTGTLAIRGDVDVDTATNGLIINGTAICTSTTAGAATACTTTTTGNRLGWGLANEGSGTVKAYIEIR